MAAGISAIVAVLVGMLLHTGPRRSGTDRTPNGNFVVSLAGGQQACQGGELLPADTAGLRVTIGTYGRPGPPISAVVTSASGKTLTYGGLAAGWKQGVVTIPLARVRQATSPAQVCLYDGQAAAPAQTIAIAGDTPDPGYTMTVAGIARPDVRLRFDYMRPGRESWLQMLPTLAHRLTLGKSGLIRHWAWIGAPLLMLLAIGLAVMLAGGAWEEGGRP